MNHNSQQGKKGRFSCRVISHGISGGDGCGNSSMNLKNFKNENIDYSS